MFLDLRCDDPPFQRRLGDRLHTRPGAKQEHTAVLQATKGYDLLRRKDDLLAEGVSAVFGIRRGEADLQALCFDAGRFTVEQAQDWLRAWGLQPRRFQTADG